MLQNSLSRRLRELTEISPENLHKIIPASVSLGSCGRKLEEFFRSHLYRNIENFSPEIMVDLLVNISKFDINYYGVEEKEAWSSLFSAIAHKIADSMEHLDIKKISRCTIALSKLGYYDEKFLIKLQEQFSNKRHLCDVYDLSIMIVSTARLNFKDTNSFESLFAEFELNVGRASLQAKVNVMYYSLMYCKNNEDIISHELSHRIIGFMERTVPQIDFSEIISIESKNQMLCVVNELKSIQRKGELHLPSEEMIRDWQRTVRLNAEPSTSKLQKRISNFLRFVLGQDIQEEKWIDQINTNVDCFIAFDPSKSTKKGLIIQVDGPKHYLINDSSKLNATTNFNTRLLSQEYEVIRISLEDIDSGLYRTILQSKILEVSDLILTKGKIKSSNRFIRLADEELDLMDLEDKKDEELKPVRSSKKTSSDKKINKKEDEDFDQVMAEFLALNQASERERLRIADLTNIETLKSAIQEGHLERVKDCLECCKQRMTNSEYKDFLNTEFSDGSTLIFMAQDSTRKEIDDREEDLMKQVNKANSESKPREATLISRKIYEYMDDNVIKSRLEIFTNLYNQGVTIEMSSVGDFLTFAVEVKNQRILLDLLNKFSIRYEEDYELIQHLLIAASTFDNLEATKIIFSKYPDLDPNIPDSRGCTALHNASINGCVSIAEFLLERCRANPNTFAKKSETEEHHITPLYAAAYKSDLDARNSEILVKAEERYRCISSMLVAHGANYDVRTIHGEHLFDYAIKGGCIDLVRKIISDNILDPLNSSSSFPSTKNNIELAKAAGRTEVAEILEEAVRSKYRLKQSNRLDRARFGEVAEGPSFVDRERERAASVTEPKADKPLSFSDRYRKKMKEEQRAKQKAGYDISGISG